MLKALRGLCLICFGVVLVALVVAGVELAFPDAVLAITGCHKTDVISGVDCGPQWTGRLLSIILNLPFMFFYAVVLVLLVGSRPVPAEFRLLMSFFFTILVFALIYPPLLFFTRKRDG